LYYAGLRTDGAATIKKKYKGSYTTLAYKPIFALDVPYDADTNPNLIPGNRWIGLRSTVKNLPGGSVAITLWADITGTGAWTEVASAVDSGTVIAEKGYAGIRTDFMDVEFDDYRAKEL